MHPYLDGFQQHLLLYRSFYPQNMLLGPGPSDPDTLSRISLCETSNPVVS